MNEIIKAYTEQLQKLAGEITTQDIKDAVYQLPLSRTSFDKYMKGDIAKPDTAAKLIKFLNTKVNNRVKQLEQTA